MEHQKDGQLVYIKDLLFAVLYRWKTVVIVMLTLALLLGGAGFLLSGEPSQQELQSLTAYETAKAVYDQRIQTLEKSIDERQAHVDGALLMALDPYNHYEAQLTISVQLPTADGGFQSAFFSQSVLEAYRAVLTEEAFLAKLAEILQQPAQYVPELIGSSEPAIGTDTITFTIKCADAATAATLAEAMEGHLVQYQEAIGQKLLPHTLSVLKSTGLAISDSALAETQRAELNRLAEILTGLTEARNKRNALVRPDVADANSKVKTAILLAAIGAALGAFLMVCILWIGHIGSGKIYSARILHNRTGVKILGRLSSDRKFGPVETWLRKLDGRPLKADPALIATDIALRTEVQSILVTGNAGCREALAKALQQAMPQAEILEAASVLECPDALKALTKCQAVVLAEACGSGSYQAVQQQLEKFEDYGKQLLGCVVVE